MTPLILDISRLISRVGRGPFTGIDRVELAYMREFLGRPEPVFFLCRMPRSYAILDRPGGQDIFDRLTQITPWGRRKAAQIFLAKRPPAGQRALADIWRGAKKICQERRLPHCVKTLLPNGGIYFNVGHSNLRDIVFKAFSATAGFRFVVLIHDVIPLTHPEFSRAKIAAGFEQKMRRVSAAADLVIYNSSYSEKAAKGFFAEYGRVPAGVVAHLGTGNGAKAGIKAITSRTEKPTFVVIGTIEPRKNHALLLEIWRKFADDIRPENIPHLHIIGQRGWGNGSVFNILDGDPIVGRYVFEYNDLTDAQVQAQLAQSTALLFPSFVEGYGLPLIEAARLGVPVLCGENAIYQEIIGDYPLYLNVDNSYLWSQRILERACRNRESEAARQNRSKSVTLPTWDGHFDRIFRFIA